MTTIGVVLANKTKEDFSRVFKLLETKIDLWYILRYYSQSTLQDLSRVHIFKIGEEIPLSVDFIVYFMEGVHLQTLQNEWHSVKGRPRLVIKDSGGQNAKWHDWTPLTGWRNGAIELK